MLAEFDEMLEKQNHGRLQELEEENARLKKAIDSLRDMFNEQAICAETYTKTMAENAKLTEELNRLKEQEAKQYII